MKYKYGETLLMKASKINNVKMMKFLLNQGVKLEDKDDYSQTALFHACYKENIEAAKLLLSKGSKFDLKYRRKIPLIILLIEGGKK